MNKRVEKPAMSGAERQALLKQRKLDQGLKRYPVWIPDTPEHTAKVVAYCEKLCKQYVREQEEGKK